MDNLMSGEAFNSEFEYDIATVLGIEVSRVRVVDREATPTHGAATYDHAVTFDIAAVGEFKSDDAAAMAAHVYALKDALVRHGGGGGPLSGSEINMASELHPPGGLWQMDGSGAYVEVRLAAAVATTADAAAAIATTAVAAAVTAAVAAAHAAARTAAAHAAAALAVAAPPAPSSAAAVWRLPLRQWR